MKHVRITLFLLAALAGRGAFAQTLTAGQVAYGDASNVMTSSPALKFSTQPGLILTGTNSDEYLSFINNGGTGHLQFDQDGRFIWWTPSSGGSKKMALTNEGQLRIGTYLVDAANVGSQYKLHVAGGGYFHDQVAVQKEMLATDVSNTAYYSASSNYYKIQGDVSNTAYHAAQANLFTVVPYPPATTATVGGYQSAAQTNTAFLDHQVYSDQGLGQIWSVQTNTFYPMGSTISNYINTYVRTQLGAGNTIGNYYSLFIEAPFGSPVSQIGNYYGVYQESSVAKNYFGGKVWIGALPTGTSSNSDAKLAVNGTINCSRVKVTQSGWADYVFEPGYHLPTLPEVEAFIKARGHLPGVASAKEIEDNGNDLGESQKMLLQKVEELTLYMIGLNKKVDALQKENEALKARK